MLVIIWNGSNTSGKGVEANLGLADHQFVDWGQGEVYNEEEGHLKRVQELEEAAFSFSKVLDVSLLCDQSPEGGHVEVGSRTVC
jgi:hypothetical protein